MRTTLTISSLVVTALIFLGGVWVGHEWEEQKYARHGEQIFSKGGGGLTNPLLECGIEADELTIGERAEIEKMVTDYVDQATREGRISHAAIYFRDLNNGPWFGINERKEFEPGSLLKLPIAMSIYYWDQRHSGVLDEKLDLTKNATTTGSVENNDDPSLRPVKPGVYSVRDLMGIMLRESNNDAAGRLAAYEGVERMQQIFADLGISPPQDGRSYLTNVKTYGAFFRMLYNASYLGQIDSEEILTTLTQATFRDGLVAGVPSFVKVAHKYGTRVTPGSTAPRQLHDCGIVYVEKTPYILCVMSQGTSMKNLERFIAGVSKIVYEGVAQ